MPGDSYPILTYLTYNNHPFSDLTVRLRSQHDLSRYLSVYSDIPCFHHSSLNPHFCWRNPIFQWINHDKSQLFILKSQEFQSQQSWSTLCMYYIYISYIYIYHTEVCTYNHFQLPSLDLLGWRTRIEPLRIAFGDHLPGGIPNRRIRAPERSLDVGNPK